MKEACLFILYKGLSMQKYCSALPFPSPVALICQNSSRDLSILGGPAPYGSSLRGVKKGPLPLQGEAGGRG